jgi:hypothetical protein
VEGTSTDQNPTATYLNAGVFEVTLKVTNSSGADSITKTTYITVLDSPDPSMSSTPDDGTSNGTATATPVGGEAPFTYSWSDGQSNQTAIGLATGWYSVTVTDVNGCEGVDSVLVAFGDGVEPIDSWSWSVSPNPSKETCTITFTGDLSGARAELITTGGQVIRNWDHVTNVIPIDAPRVAGMYLFRITNDKGQAANIKLLRID